MTLIYICFSHKKDDVSKELFIFLTNNARKKDVKTGMDFGSNILIYFLRYQVKETLLFLKNAFGSSFKGEILKILKDSDFTYTDPQTHILVHSSDTAIYLLGCGFSAEEVIEDVLENKIFSHNDGESEHTFCQISPPPGSFVTWIRRRQNLLLSYVAEKTNMQKRIIE